MPASNGSGDAPERSDCGLTLAEAIRERDEMRRANVTPEDADRPLGQSVEYWQEKALDYVTDADRKRVEASLARHALGAFIEATAGPVGRLKLDGHPEATPLYDAIRAARAAYEGLRP